MSSAIQIHSSGQVSSTSLPEGLSFAPCTQGLPILHFTSSAVSSEMTGLCSAPSLFPPQRLLPRNRTGQSSRPQANHKKEVCAYKPASVSSAVPLSITSEPLSPLHIMKSVLPVYLFLLPPLLCSCLSHVTYCPSLSLVVFIVCPRLVFVFCPCLLPSTLLPYIDNS